MREYVIEKQDAGQSLLKYLNRLLKEAPMSFFYKMLRKKNITLNGKKADGHEIVNAGDTVKIFVSEDTFNKFTPNTYVSPVTNSDVILDIVYEDDNILLINKPEGMLSQKSEPSDVSANEYCIDYLIKSGVYNPDNHRAFKPAVCNRLDRNTTGILIVAKSLIGARLINDSLKKRTIHKYYVCPVKGIVNEHKHLKGSLSKDRTNNRVVISDSNGDNFIETDIQPIKCSRHYTLLEVELLTGKSHQIRAHLASIGHPLLGDNKYGDRELNKRLGLKYQLLHSYKLIMPEFAGDMEYLSGKTFEIEIPEIYKRLLEEDNGNLE